MPEIAQCGTRTQVIDRIVMAGKCHLVVESIGI